MAKRPQASVKTSRKPTLAGKIKAALRIDGQPPVVITSIEPVGEQPEPQTAVELLPQETSATDEKSVDAVPTTDVALVSESQPSALTLPITGEKTMAEITFALDAKPRKSISVADTATGYPGSVRVSKTLFANKTAPAFITVQTDALAGPRHKETKEERKARLAAQPKKTDAEKLAALEARTARMRAKLAKPEAVAV